MYSPVIKSYFFLHPQYWSKLSQVAALVAMLLLAVSSLVLTVCLSVNFFSGGANKPSIDDAFVYNRLSEVLRLKNISQDQAKLHRALRCEDAAVSSCIKVSGNFIDKNSVSGLQSNLPAQRVMALEKSCLACHQDKQNHLVKWTLEHSSPTIIVDVVKFIVLLLVVLATAIVCFWLWSFLRKSFLLNPAHRDEIKYAVVTLRVDEIWRAKLDRVLKKTFFRLDNTIKLLLGMAPSGLIRFEQNKNHVYLLIEAPCVEKLFKALSEVTVEPSASITFSALQFNHHLTHIRSYHAHRLAALIMNKLKGNILLFDAAFVKIEGESAGQVTEQKEIKTVFFQKYREFLKTASYKNNDDNFSFFWLKWQDLQK